MYDPPLALCQPGFGIRLVRQPEFDEARADLAPLFIHVLPTADPLAIRRTPLVVVLINAAGTAYAGSVHAISQQIALSATIP